MFSQLFFSPLKDQLFQYYSVAKKFGRRYLFYIVAIKNRDRKRTADRVIVNKVYRREYISNSIEKLLRRIIKKKSPTIRATNGFIAGVGRKLSIDSEPITFFLSFS